MNGVLELCRKLSIDASTITHVYHGTTIATNAVLEYKGSRTGMITTKGYRDIIHIGRHQRPMHYSICRRFLGSIIRWCAAPSEKSPLKGSFLPVAR